jgi:hypothetical protein
MIYHYLFRHTRLCGKQALTIGTRALQTKIGHGMDKGRAGPIINL